MPIRIKCHIKPENRTKPTGYEVLASLWQSLEWRVMLTENQDSLPYADQSNHYWAGKGLVP